MSEKNIEKVFKFLTFALFIFGIYVVGKVMCDCCTKMKDSQELSQLLDEKYKSYQAKSTSPWGALFFEENLLSLSLHHIKMMFCWNACKQSFQSSFATVAQMVITVQMCPTHFSPNNDSEPGPLKYVKIWKINNATVAQMVRARHW